MFDVPIDKVAIKTDVNSALLQQNGIYSERQDRTRSANKGGSQRRKTVDWDDYSSQDQIKALPVHKIGLLILDPLRDRQGTDSHIFYDHIYTFKNKYKNPILT